MHTESEPKWIPTSDRSWVRMIYCPHCRTDVEHVAVARNVWATVIMFGCTSCKRPRPIEL